METEEGDGGGGEEGGRDPSQLQTVLLHSQHLGGGGGGGGGTCVCVRLLHKDLRVYSLLCVCVCNTNLQSLTRAESLGKNGDAVIVQVQFDNR